MVGVTVSIIAYQYLHSKGKSSDRRSVLLLSMNLRWFPVIMLSLYLALLSNNSYLLLESKLINYCRGNQIKR